MSAMNLVRFILVWLIILQLVFTSAPLMIAREYQASYPSAFAADSPVKRAAKSPIQEALEDPFLKRLAEMDPKELQINIAPNDSDIDLDPFLMRSQKWIPASESNEEDSVVVPNTGVAWKSTRGFRL